VSNIRQKRWRVSDPSRPLHTVQPPYILFEREIEMMSCRTPQARLATLAYGALCRGLLSGAMSADRHFAKGRHAQDHGSQVPATAFRRVHQCGKQADAFARENFGKRVIHLAVRWLLDQPGVGITLWGARHPEQLAPVKEVIGWSLKKSDFAAIDAILSESIQNPAGPEFMAPPARAASPVFCQQ